MGVEVVILLGLIAALIADPAEGQVFHAQLGQRVLDAGGDGAIPLLGGVWLQHVGLDRAQGLGGLAVLVRELIIIIPGVAGELGGSQLIPGALGLGEQAGIVAAGAVAVFLAELGDLGEVELGLGVSQVEGGPAHAVAFEAEGVDEVDIDTKFLLVVTVFFGIPIQYPE